MTPCVLSALSEAEDQVQNCQRCVEKARQYSFVVNEALDKL